MTSRERVLRTISHQNPDKMPLEIYAAPGGLHEHEQKLVDLYRRYPSDFSDTTNPRIVHPAPDEYDDEGNYRAIRRDEWGILWEHTVFGAWGIPREHPLEDMVNLKNFTLPPAPALSGPDFEAAKERAEEHRKQYYHQVGAGNIFEIMHSLRRFEDVLMDIYEDTDEINALADMLFDHRAKLVEYALALDADGVSFGDDWGTQEALIMSLPVWRRFFKPRYERLMAPVREAGKNIHFHSCGQVRDLLPDLAELGVNSIWPQLPVYDYTTLAQTARELGMSLALHIDRAHLMTFGTPDEVRQGVREAAEVFKRAEGGAWFYVEIECGFPWENVVALFEEIDAVR